MEELDQHKDWLAARNYNSKNKRCHEKYKTKIQQQWIK